MRALSIRQPYAELILRGIKRVEYRSRATRIIGERFLIYTPLKVATEEDRKIWSRDLSMAARDSLPAWMIELAEQVGMIPEGTVLPTGVIVGSAVIEKVEEIADLRFAICDLNSNRKSQLENRKSIYRWHLTDVERAKNCRKPTRHPQPVWFKPF